jgi:hypothetical protein
MGRAEDAGQPPASSARIEPGEKEQPPRAADPGGTSAADPADTGGEEPGGSPAFVPVTEEDVTALEERVCEDDYDSARQQAIARNLARREEDRELIVRLAKSKFEGPGQDLFEEELAAYGYPVMMAWTRTGEIMKKAKEIRRPLSVPEMFPPSISVVFPHPAPAPGTPGVAGRSRASSGSGRRSVPSNRSRISS